MSWGAQTDSVYPVELLRWRRIALVLADISEVYVREKLNVVGVI